MDLPSHGTLGHAESGQMGVSPGELATAECPCGGQINHRVIKAGKDL